MAKYTITIEDREGGSIVLPESVPQELKDSMRLEVISIEFQREPTREEGEDYEPTAADHLAMFVEKGIELHTKLMQDGQAGMATVLMQVLSSHVDKRHAEAEAPAEPEPKAEQAPAT